MTTNTYQALCDDVGAYEEKNSCKKDFECGFLESNDFDTCIYCSEYSEYKKYYKQSAEQRERLEALILRNGYCKRCNISIIISDDVTTYCFEGVPKKSTLYNYSEIDLSDRGKTRSDALYALTHKLVTEKVLSKEEVAKALKGGE